MACSTNFLLPTGFGFQLDKTPEVERTVQRISIPGLSLGEAAWPTTFGTRLVEPGNVHYNGLVVEFPILEDMANWIEVFDWINELGTPNDMGDYDATKHDATVMILSSDKRPVKTIRFIDVFPAELSTFEMDVTVTEPGTPLVGQVTFSYDRMVFD